MHSNSDQFNYWSNETSIDTQGVIQENSTRCEGAAREANVSEATRQVAQPKSRSDCAIKAKEGEASECDCETIWNPIDHHSARQHWEIHVDDAE